MIMSSCDFLSKLEIQRQAVSDFIHAFLMPLFSHIIYVIGTLKKKIIKKKKKTYVIGFLATSDNNVPQAQITRYEGQHLMKTSMVMPTDTAGDFVWT